MSLTAVAAVAVPALLEFLVAEFPERVHPVRAFGRIAGAFDRDWRTPQLVGVLLALWLPLFAAAVAWLLVRVALVVHPAVGTVVAGIALYATTSRRMLLEVALEVVDLTEEDLDAARGRLRALAGREASGLSAGQVRSAALESAAENLADGLVGPLLAFGVGALLGLPVAAAAAAWVKGVNTLDSMLGYRDTPVGRASARLDDFVMYVPARVSASLIALAGSDPDALRTARSRSTEPSSPNAGWPMATLGAVVGTRLEKPGAYVLDPAGPLPDAGRSRAGLSVVGRAGLLAYVVAAGLALTTSTLGRALEVVA